MIINCKRENNLNSPSEKANHLGNVCVVINDKKTPTCVSGNPIAWTAEVIEANDYYPFGQVMPSRTYLLGSKKDRYTFNGKETDSETGLQDYGMRTYNPVICRFLSVDPLSVSYPYLTPYQFASNSPISGIDLDGLEYFYAADGTYLGQGKDKSNLEVRRADDFEIHADGTFTINQSTFVHGNINEFKKMAAVLYAEADGTTSEAVDEVAGIYSVLENRAKVRDTKVIEQMKTGEGYGVAGAGDKEMNRINTEKGSEADAKRKAVFAGLIKGILSETDFSNGAFYWDGKDFEKGGGHDQRYSPGYKFTNKDHDLFGQKDNKKPGSNVFKFKNPKTPPVTKTWDYKYQSTNAIGKTTFSKLTDAYRNAQHLTKKADEFGVVPKK